MDLAIENIISEPEQEAYSFDINSFKELVFQIKNGSKKFKIEGIKNVLSFKGMIVHQTHKVTKRIIVSNSKTFEYLHENQTSQKLIQVDYDVLFIPKGYFDRNEKKFDVFLLRDHIFLEADLKCINTINPDTIGKRIKGGSEQSSRIVLDINSNINKRVLIDGLRLGCNKNYALIEIMLFYNSRFYCLSKPQILNNKIFKLII